MSTGHLRAGWRLLLIAKTTALFYLLLLLGTVVFLPSRRMRVRCRNFCFRNWSRCALRVMNVRIETLGAAPEPPFFLVANHLSYVDIAVLASRVDAIFIAKSEVAGWPAVGHLCRSFGTLFVDRNLRKDIPRVIAEVEDLLAGGQGVVLFPEGTSTPGLEVAPFRPALLEVAARSRYPVSYAALTYRSHPGSPSADLSICWWGDMSFKAHFLRLLGLPGFTATLSFGEETIQESDRKLLAERLRSAVARRFTPVAGAAPGSA